MKYLQFIALLSLMLNMLVPQAFSQAYPWQPLSANDAIQEVRNFEGNQGLGVSVAQTPSVQSEPAPWVNYVLTAGNYEYHVCAYSRDVFSRRDMNFILDKPTFYGQPYDPNALKPQAISQAASQAIALTFMQSHFPYYTTLTQTKVWPEYDYDTATGNPVFIKDYEFAFFEKSVSGVGGPSECRVTVDTIHGKIINYIAKAFPLLINLTPGISADQATAFAMNTLNIVQGTPMPATGLVVSLPDAFGNETLLYGVNFTGIPMSQGQTDTTGMSPENYTATVDAFSGEVVYTAMLMNIVGHYTPKETQSFSLTRKAIARKHNPLLKELQFAWAGQLSKLNYSPVSVGKTAYVCMDYLGYHSANIKVTTKGNCYNINGLQRHITFKLDSRMYLINGQTKQMSVKPVFVNGRCYVPLDVMQTVLGGQWSYDKQTQIVRYDPRKPVATKPTKTSGLPMLAAFLLSVSLLTVTAAVCKPHAPESSNRFSK